MSTDWKMLSIITEERSSTEHYTGLINVDSCSLHVVHGAFRSDESKPKWGIDTLLKALHNLFDESTTKRENYAKITGSSLPFCGHRWPEDKSGAERTLKIWPEITAYIRETLKKPKSQIPTSKIFSKVRSAVQDSLITERLEFFVSVAVILKPYLEISQSDALLSLFIMSELQVMKETLMGKLVKRQELEAAGTHWRFPRSMCWKQSTMCLHHRLMLDLLQLLL